MATDHPRVTRRSISHGALNNSYVNMSRISSDSGHHLPPFRPLRSIREHQHTHLDPSNSVAGMLRKTTETGNIGIFSIGKSTGLRPRASLGDLRQSSRFLFRSGEVAPAQDDRRQLPSYRDSTSEIISMYAAENLSGKSGSGTLSPLWDDCGPRSYSMTTCGSKSYYTPRNNDLSQMLEFHQKGQRPRSPYPYPTRLARPGVRPSSPALTENGLVDYSRMVEINRISQRTTHHPHKTLFPHQTTRNRPPLSMRYGINQSTLSPTDDLGSSRRCEPSLGKRPCLSNDPHFWHPEPMGRWENEPHDQTLRTMSLTSMSGGYSSTALKMPCHPPVPKKPLFYDYSEDFEDVVETPEICPVAPIPRRVSVKFSPLIAENDPALLLNEAAEEEVDKEILSCVELTPDAQGVEGSGTFERDQYQPVSQIGQQSSSTQLLPHIDDRDSSASMTEPRQDDVVEEYDPPPMIEDKPKHAVERSTTEVAVVRTEIPHSMEPTSDSTGDSLTQPVTPGIDFGTSVLQPPGLKDDHSASSQRRPRDNEREADLSASKAISGAESYEGVVSPHAVNPGSTTGASANRCSDYRKDSRLFSMSSGLSDLASFVKYIDRHIQSADMEDDSRDDLSGIQSSRMIAGLDLGSMSNKMGKTVPPPPRKSSLRPCGAHNTGMKPSGGPSMDDQIDQFQVVSTRTGPTLVPQPISPAKLLRVKNSIPQLMKALPPLPGYSPAPESPFGPAVVPVDFEPFEISRLTDARSSLIEDVLQGRRGHSEDSPKGHDPFVFDRQVQKPRLKLKHAVSCAPGNSRDLRRGYFEQADVGYESRPSTAGQPSFTPIKRRLPIKISRNALASSVSEESGTVRRRPDLKKSITVSELTSKQPINLFGEPVTPKVQDVPVPQTVPVRPEDVPSGIAPQRTPMAEARGLTHGDDVLSPFAEIRLSSLDDLHAASEGHGEAGMQSFFSRNDIHTPRRGLRTRISNLKAKLSEPKTYQQSPLRNDTHEDCTPGENQIPKPEVSSTTNTFRDLLSSSSQSRNEQKNPANQKIRSRLGRFMQGAKHRLRIWSHHRRRID